MIKTVTFASIHFTIATLVAFTLTGDFLLGSMIAMVEPSINTGAFYVHEKLWQHVRFLKQHEAMTQVKTASFAVIHFGVAFSVTYLITGDAFIGGLMATVEPAINSIAYFFHEKVWLRKTQHRDTLAYA